MQRPEFDPWVGRSPGEGNGYPLQYSCLENPMDRGAWWLQSMGLQRVRHEWTSNTFTFFHYWFKEPAHRKSPRCWERLKTGGDGWMASLTQRTRVWGNSGRWWRTGKPACCSPLDHKVRHDSLNNDNSSGSRGRRGQMLGVKQVLTNFTVLNHPLQ